MKLKKSKTITLRLRNKNAQNSRMLLRGFKTQDGKLWEGDVLFKEFSQLQDYIIYLKLSLFSLAKIAVNKTYSTQL